MPENMPRFAQTSPSPHHKKWNNVQFTGLRVAWTKTTSSEAASGYRPSLSTFPATGGVHESLEGSKEAVPGISSARRNFFRRASDRKRGIPTTSMNEAEKAPSKIRYERREGRHRELAISAKASERGYNSTKDVQPN